MMTCRLLYALLVLALCCCPSVCVTGTGEVTNKGSPNSSPSQPQGAGGAGPGGAGSLSGSIEGQTSSSEDGTVQITGENGTVASETQDKESPGTIPKEGQGSGPNGSESPGGSASPDAASSSVTASVSAQSQKENAPTTTTTTTTKAPTTTTTTTTEAPTTTTTRAPSLLREIDGSLGSSAWVCAPLLLAVSALAYTTVG
ncbi:mucin TcMUCII [Trypanosoma cruzi cruzi]|uniref:Putative mucin TcMUCII n=1 Tax=Trypanosoma cruzi TaxID=5693 RepID=A0A2V2UX48_TRYCR|nr:mucin TcMUCII [Trypanosoma cruzi cruzi]PWU88709.1 putative mucin TcMUCII [Trypanosoma cruzi]